MTKKQFNSIKLDSLAFEKLTYLCKAMNQKKSVYLSELITQIFECAGTFESLNVSYTVYGNSVRLEFSGRNRIVSGSFVAPNSESDASVSAKVMEKSKIKLGENHE